MKMKKVMVMFCVMSMILPCMACNKVPTEPISYEPAPEEEDAEMNVPSNFLEERCGRTSFDSYDEIIGLLKGEEGYAKAKVLGSDEEVLFISDSIYDYLEGSFVAMNADVYSKKSDGKITSDGLSGSDSTATPIAIAKDGCIMIATHTSMEKLCYGENGTPNKGIMAMEYVYKNYGDAENNEPDTYGGFIREKNTVLDNDGVEIAEDDSAAFDSAYDEYFEATKLSFTRVDGSVPSEPTSLE